MRWRCIQEWQPLLSYFLSYLPFLCLNLISCPFCNSITRWSILILLGRSAEQDETMCCLQVRQCWLSYFWSCLPYLCLNLVLCLLCNTNTLHNILMILKIGRNGEQDKMAHRLQEWQLWWGLWGTVLCLFVFCGVFLFCFFRKKKKLF